MLQAMEQTAAPANSSSSFAGLLAALTAPAQERKPAWSDDGLADDVATLSYERALRTHARYKATDPSDHSLTQQVDEVLNQTPAPPPADQPRTAAQAAARQATPAMKTEARPEPVRQVSTDFERNLKCASITIRLSQEEAAQLRQRAAEAGLTLSAYMRSCTFEAESLRALVKDTLAQLRSEPSRPAPTKVNPVAQEPEQRSRFSWLSRLWPRANARHAAQA
jgi:predicted DNA binding CopG/RHH family protein